MDNVVSIRSPVSEEHWAKSPVINLERYLTVHPISHLQAKIEVSDRISTHAHPVILITSTESDKECGHTYPVMQIDTSAGVRLWIDCFGVVYVKKGKIE